MSEQPGLSKYPNVFSPISLGPVEIPNRIYMSPHGIPIEAQSPDADSAQPSVNRIYYFAERAAGGTGLIIHSTQIAPGPAQTNLAESIAQPEHVPSYRRVAEAVHGHGSKIMAEIWYVNWLPKRWEVLGPLAPAIGPSATQNLYMPWVRREMTKHEIDRMIDVYRTSARNVREAGYDGIQVHISHGSIVEYFLTPYHNKRTDEYGGSFENRARFMMEALEACRDELSDEMALGIRINADELLPGGMDEDDVKETLRYLVKSQLIDFVDLDVSMEPEQAHLMTTGMFDPVMHNAARVARVREGAGPLPVLATPGRVTSIADSEKLITDGVTDMVGIVRGLIAEPELVNKARDGRDDERRICVAVNHCVGQISPGWGCAINPGAGREQRMGDRLTGPAPTSQRVVIVGGGPAGLEAARIAATRGHTVTVLEGGDRLGGGVALWADLPGRSVMRSLVNYLSGRMNALGVEVRTGEEATVENVLELEPDTVIVATGSRYRRDGSSGFVLPPIEGWDQELVLGLEEIIRGEVKPSGKVLVLDDEGMHAAIGVAELMARNGAQVDYVTRHMMMAPNLEMAMPYVARRVAEAGVNIRTMHYVKSIGEHSATIYDIGTQEEQTLDGLSHVVLATMREPIDSLYEQLSGKVPYVYLVGDALAPRTLKEATYEGNRFARVIGEPDAPASVQDELFRSDLARLKPASTAPEGAGLEQAPVSVPA
jgi:2,4-dienoyl-CoA reductase-like NADH-dependent reductase (Old Yellow Enzyme family)/pyruvate/2-oxoglutarate dehydrogenase complex dihydrolipoamide dehydrogenase (E3) component